MKKHILTISFTTIFLFLMGGAVYGQGISLTFNDSQTNDPVVGLVVLLQSSPHNTSIITDNSGRIQVARNMIPCSIITKHISYKPFSEKDINTSKVIYLDSNTEILSDVVISDDQYQQTSINSDLFVISTISHESLAQLGANNVADVLNFTDNVSITQEVGTGRSTVSMFGLSGEYVKILVDNVPLVSDNGLGNDIDISQINLDNVERIEIVEGAMGVLYGANAVAGVINIVTKNQHDSKLSISSSIQEETIGNEYNWSDQGRHIQSLQVDMNPSGPVSFSTNINHNNFNGFWNDKRGKDYYGSEKTRGYEWSPKEQLRAGAKINYQLPNEGTVSYQFDYYQEDINIYSSVINDKNGSGDIPYYTANDEYFYTQRFSHNLSSHLSLGKNDLQVWLSYQTQSRYNEAYVYRIERRLKIESSGLNKDQSSDILYSKATFKQALPKAKKLKLTTGYEYDYQQGYDAIASGDYADSLAINKLYNIDFFAISDWSISKKTTITPGARININSNFGYQMIWNNTFKYSHNDYSLKLIVGSANKTPNYTQLYRYFVDSNHNVTGNPNLNPETGFSFLINLGKSSRINSILLNNELSLSHFNINDKIDLSTITEDDPNAANDITRSTYININQYKSLGFTLKNKLAYKSLNIGLNLTYNGLNQSLEGDDGKYKYTLTVNSNLSYKLPKINTTIASNLKHVGENERYFQDDEGDYLATVYAYTLINTSITQPFFDNTFTVTLGARNLTNIININTASNSQEGVHDSQSSDQQLFAYGRSYFVKMTYSFKSSD